MPSTPPVTVEDVIALGNPDPVFSVAWEVALAQNPALATLSPNHWPQGKSDSNVIMDMKASVASNLPNTQAQLAATRPADLSESECTISLSTGFDSRMIVVAPMATTSSPIIVWFLSGSHCLSSPELEIPIVRTLSKECGVTFILPTYGLAPERAFPNGVSDAWAALKHIASEATGPTSQ